MKNELENGFEFKSQKQIDANNIRGVGGIGVAITRYGEIIWMGGGAHRLAIAKILKLKNIPVFLKLVHHDAIINKDLKK